VIISLDFVYGPCHCRPIVCCFIKIHIGLTFLVLVYSDCPERVVCFTSLTDSIWTLLVSSMRRQSTCDVACVQRVDEAQLWLRSFSSTEARRVQSWRPQHGTGLHGTPAYFAVMLDLSDSEPVEWIWCHIHKHALHYNRPFSKWAWNIQCFFFYFLFHLFQTRASFWSQQKLFKCMSMLTPSRHVFLGLPVCLIPSVDSAVC